MEAFVPNAFVTENYDRFTEYCIEWNTVGVAELPWQNLAKKYPGKKDARKAGRHDIVRHLIQQLPSNEEVRSGCTRLKVLRETLDNYGMCTDAFYELATKEGLRSKSALMTVVAIYLSLYYSKVEGKFAIKNFADNYRTATSF